MEPITPHAHPEQQQSKENEFEPNTAGSTPQSQVKGLRYQLYNPAHTSELTRLFKDAKRFCLNSEAEDTDQDEIHYEDEDLTLEDDPVTPLQRVDTETEEKDTARLSCGTCGMAFDELLQQRQHYQLDWHRYNVKRRAHNQGPVSEAQFNDMMEDLSSISGSDEDEDNPTTEVNLSRLLNRVGLETQHHSSNSSGRRVLGSPKMYFETSKGEIISTYKTLFYHKKDQCRLDTENVNLNELLSNPLKIAVIMLSGGHFAACVFHGSQVLIHKTIHKYTVRAKQGGGQSSRDNRGGPGIKSSGASLRRQNEMALTQNIQELLESWKPFLIECDVILYRVSSLSQQIFFGGKTPLFQKSNPKFRTIPIQTKRPTFGEAKRVLAYLTTVEVYDKSTFLSNFTLKTVEAQGTKHDSPSKKSSKKISNVNRARSRSPKKHEEPQEVLSSPDEGSDSELNVVFNIQEVDYEPDFTSLKEYDDSLTRAERQKGRQRRRPRTKIKESTGDLTVPTGIAGKLLEVLNSNDGQMQTRFIETLENGGRTATDPYTFITQLNQALDNQNSTILHMAVKKNVPDVIWSLLELGADPSLKDKQGKYPYNYAESKDGRNLFRKFRAKFPDKFDYNKAQIPPPLTEEMEQDLAEKKKLQNKLKREKEKLKKQEKMEKQNEIEEKNRFLNLSDRDKRALAAERRILGQCKKSGEVQPVLLRCFDCGVDITGKVPFEYNQNQFCTPKCLAAHRKKFPTPLSV